MTDTTKATRREVTLPAAALVDLIAAARGHGDGDLRERGRAAGRLFAERLLSSHEEATSTRALPAAEFWKRVNELFSSRGWGALTHAPAGPGVAELRSGDWIEAERPDHSGSCGFTAGLLQGLLATVSGADVDVREAECRAAGGQACRFQFGSRAALDVAAATASAA